MNIFHWLVVLVFALIIAWATWTVVTEAHDTTKTGVCTVSKSMGSPQYKCLEELND